MLQVGPVFVNEKDMVALNRETSEGSARNTSGGGGIMATSGGVMEGGDNGTPGDKGGAPGGVSDRPPLLEAPLRMSEYFNSATYALQAH
ncbi:hypothetical protein U1Q18_010345 [Sarracenia purpurea var. burkii]